ncbi:MAG: AAA family ATPase [Planctomycetes bacterium]|nr:AAA family ATPase [Planctomycetota bacterium]
MYIDQIQLDYFRTFRRMQEPIPFVHPDQDFESLGFPRPKLPNINLLLGNNGFGKTTMLKGIALAALGPAVGKSGIYPYRLVRREVSKTASENGVLKPAVIQATFTAHPQDDSPPKLESHIEVVPQGDIESLEWKHSEEKAWHPVFSSSSDALFLVGYGATRRVEKPNRTERSGGSAARARRVMSLFEEDYALRPLNTWLPGMRSSNKGRFTQVVHLINRLMGKGHYTFEGEQDEEGEFLFDRSGMKLPFPALSDGYRAYLGWIADLLFHVCMTCPSGKKLVENKGIVLVDEIDLHLHPKWQLTVLPTLAKQLPNIQFVVTSHSPLVVGSLEWMNIIVMTSGTKQSSVPQRIGSAVHGLDADQVLLTEFFGMESTRSPGKNRRLKELSLQARHGDTEAAKQILQEMSSGTEAPL